MDEKQSFEFPGKHYEDGIPLHGIMSTSNHQFIKNMPLYDGDVIVTGYPKSGNHWLETIIEALENSHRLEEFEKSGSQRNRLPIDIDTSMQQFLSVKRPSFFMTHLRYWQLPTEMHSKKVKIINISRNPKDVAVSFYNFHVMCEDYMGPWDKFLQAFLDGEVCFGSWFDYMKDWNQQRHNQNVLFIKYEDMIINPTHVISDISKFLGKSLDRKTIEHIARLTSFKAMKSNPNLNVTSALYEKNNASFLRKGKFGDWKKWFTVHQNEVFDALYKQFELDTGLDFTFE